MYKTMNADRNCYSGQQNELLVIIQVTNTLDMSEKYDGYNE